MKKIYVVISVLASLLMFTAIPPAVVAAASCGDVQTSIEFPGCEKGVGGVTSIILWIINFMAAGVGIAAVGGIAWGGFVYTQAAGDSGKTKEAIQIIRNAVIAVVLFVGLFALANFFVPGGVFN